MANSTYLQYLPPVLWVPDNDPAQALGRHLRIYEKLLTGFPADGLAVRAAAPFVSAQLDTILLADAADSARFAAGDWITIEGTAERRRIDHFVGATIFLDANLVGVYALGGTVRIANLVPGQTTFRADNALRVDAGCPLNLLQAGVTEDVIIQSADAAFITLRAGLVNAYSMVAGDVPVKLIDGVSVTHGGRAISDFESQIDRLSSTFNPWRTRPEFLDWLASWVALELPADWSEYQKRRLISQMTRIYQQRGLKQGIYTYLDIYAVSPAQPRITVDDGEAILHARFAPDGGAVLRAVAHSNTVSPVSLPTRTVSPLLHPMGLAFDSSNQMFVCDAGDTTLSVPRPPALWRVSATGSVDYGPPVAPLPMPMPTPLYAGLPLRRPCAVTVDSINRVAVLDSGNITSATTQRGAIFRFAPPLYALTTVITDTVALPFHAIHPVDMTLDAAGNFIVLDRGRHPLGNPPSGSTNPQIVVVSEVPALTSVPHPLPGVAEPTAIIAEPGGTFIVADAGNQMTATPANLWRVNPAAGWTVTSLLGAMPAGTNPLVFPTGMVWRGANVLLVCDTGLRWGFVGDPSNRVMAETPHLYMVNLGGPAPVILRVTRERHLVTPTKMAWDRNGKLLITDRGEAQNNAPNRNWRAGVNEFGVSVFFSNQRPTSATQRNAFRRGLVNVIDGERVAHIAWWIDF